MTPTEIVIVFNTLGYANCRSAYWGGKEGLISVPPLEGEWLPEQIKLMKTAFAGWLELAHKEAGDIIEETRR